MISHLHRYIPFIFIVVLLYSIPARAQDARAKFEEAEQLYQNSNYKAALSKIEEVEHMLGTTNPRILFLKISTLYSLLKDNARFEYETLDAIRRNSHQYLNGFSQANIPAEKIAEVKRIAMEVNSSSYPGNKEEFDNKRNSENAVRRTQLIAEITAKISASQCTHAAVQTYESIKREIILYTTTFECTPEGDVTIFIETHDMERKKKLLKTMRKTITFNIGEINEIFRKGSKRDSYGDYSEGYIAINSKSENITVRREDILNPKSWPKDFVAKNNVDETSVGKGSVFYYCKSDDVPALLMELKRTF